jgi:hypothetical protein
MADISLSADVDTSGVAAGMAAIENQVSRSARTIGQTLQGYFTAGVLIAEINKVLNATDQVHKEAARFSIDAEQFQKVANAGKEIGLSGDVVVRALNFMEIGAQKALDPTTKEALALENLGISAKAFAAATPWEKTLMLAQAMSTAADKGSAYADIATIINRRNTEFIALLTQGTDKIKEYSGQFPILSKKEIDALHAIKVEEEKYFANLDSWTAKAIVKYGEFFDYVRTGFYNFGLVLQGGLTPQNQRITPGQANAMMGPAAASLMVPLPPGVSTPPAQPEGSGEGNVGGLAESIRLKTAGLSIDQKIVELDKQREFLQAAFNASDEQTDEHAATRYQLGKEIKAIDVERAELAKRLALEEQKGVDAADLKIQKSKDQVAIDELEMQLQAAEVNGQTLLANSISSQIALTKINLDYEEKIQKALDDANLAREKGLKDTAAENDLLAQQLEDEKQIALAQQEQTNAINARAAQAANMQRSTDAFGVMAREGISMGQFDWVTDPRQKLLYRARAQLEALTGQNQFGTAERAMINANEAAWAQKQQQGASQRAATSLSQQEAYWQDIIAGRTPAGNPFEAMYGMPNFSTGAFTPLSQGAQTDLISNFISQLRTVGGNNQIITLLQQLVYNTGIVRI